MKHTNGHNTDTLNPATLTVTLPASQQQVSVAPLTVGQMELLSQATQHNQPSQALKRVLMTCIQTPTNLNLDILLACDCNALMLAMRRATFGDDCDYNTACPACDKSNTYAVDLSQLPLRKGDAEIVDKQLQDPQATHAFTFPHCGLRAHFRLCTGKQLFDESPQQPSHDLYSTGPLLHALLQRLCRVEGLQESGMPLKVFVRDVLSAGDATLFLQLYKEVEPGYDDTVQLTCPHCQASFEHTLSMDASHFFRPSRRRKSSVKPN